MHEETKDNVGTACGDCPNTHSSGPEKRRHGEALLSSVRILTFNRFSSNRPSVFSFQTSYPQFAGDMAETKRQLRSGKKAGCVFAPSVCLRAKK